MKTGDRLIHVPGARLENTHPHTFPLYSQSSKINLLNRLHFQIARIVSKMLSAKNWPKESGTTTNLYSDLKQKTKTKKTSTSRPSCRAKKPTTSTPPSRNRGQELFCCYLRIIRKPSDLWRRPPQDGDTNFLLKKLLREYFIKLPRN